MNINVPILRWILFKIRALVDCNCGSSVLRSNTSDGTEPVTAGVSWQTTIENEAHYEKRRQLALPLITAIHLAYKKRKYDHSQTAKKRTIYKANSQLRNKLLKTRIGQHVK